ncbi:hypothetical protein A4D02_34670 [Niastella koreensis]|uniref:DUF2116 family Zn-ribbon domain-containing protein n=2 Tax=Niastella koreensis TaxID=354356 RepID=G8TRS5_NIAKG|nr:hypothetical protein Niako_5995 [Niastella koreensis GR20-10]OQP45097.1 hypothetical protein A4D02_34670 [Niastella koreensis]
MITKTCVACNKPIKGRIDKKFCDDSCRNNFNNRLHNYSIPVVRNINKILRKNRWILEDLLSGRKNKMLIIERKELVEKGFQFEYFTELFHPYKKKQYYYCYDYGYRSINSKKVMAIKDTRKRHKTYFSYLPNNSNY